MHNISRYPRAHHNYTETILRQICNYSATTLDYFAAIPWQFRDYLLTILWSPYDFCATTITDFSSRMWLFCQYATIAWPRNNFVISWLFPWLFYNNFVIIPRLFRDHPAIVPWTIPLSIPLECNYSVTLDCFH